MQGNKEIIQIIEQLTAIIEHNPGETIKTALIEGIKVKTKALKDQYKKVKQEPEPIIRTIDNSYSIPNEIIINQTRELKNSLVKNKQFEEAAPIRALELKYLTKIANPETTQEEAEKFIREGWEVLHSEVEELKNTTGPQPGEETETKQRPEVIRFGEYIRKLSFSKLQAQPMEQHYEDFAQS